MADEYDDLLDTFTSPKRRSPDYRQLYEKVGRQYGVDPDLLYRQGKQESVNFNPRYVLGPGKSPAGAAGLSQFMPDTARQYGLRVGNGVDERYNPEKAADAQARMMRDLIAKYGDTRLALAAYNSGHNKTPEQARRAMQRIPETRGYVQKIAPQGDAYDSLLDRKEAPAQSADPYDKLLDDFQGQTPPPTETVNTQAFATIPPRRSVPVDNWEPQAIRNQRKLFDAPQRPVRKRPLSQLATAGVQGVDPWKPQGLRQQERMFRPPAQTDVMSAAPPQGTLSRLKDAALEYMPGIRSLDTPAGVKLDAPRGFLRGVTIGALGESRPITQEDLLVDPEAETRRDVAEMAGETVGAVVPYVGTAKALTAIPRLARPTVAAHVARNALTFGGVEAAREGIHAAKTGEPIQPAEIAISTGIGAAMGGIAGVSPSMKRQVVAFLTPGVAVDVARGTPPEQAIQNALTNLGFALTSGARGPTEAQLRARMRARPETVQERPRPVEQRVEPEVVERVEPVAAPAVVPPAVEAAERRQIRREFSRIKEREDARAIEAQPDVTAQPETIEPAALENPPPAATELRARVAPRELPPVDAVLPERAGGESGLSDTAQRFYHRDWGNVVEAVDQTGARKGKTKVYEEGDPSKIHYPRTADLRGRGNERMVPLKESPVQPAETAAGKPLVPSEMEAVRPARPQPSSPESEGLIKQPAVEPEAVSDSTRYYELAKLPLTKRGQQFLEFRKSLDKLQEDQRDDLYKGLYQHLRSGFEKDYMRGGAEIQPIKDKGIEWFAREMRSAYNKGEIKTWEDVKRLASPVSGSFRGASVVGREAVQREKESGQPYEKAVTPQVEPQRRRGREAAESTITMTPELADVSKVKFPALVSSDSAKADYLARQHKDVGGAQEFRELSDRYYRELANQSTPTTPASKPAAEKQPWEMPDAELATWYRSLTPDHQLRVLNGRLGPRISPALDKFPVQKGGTPIASDQVTSEAKQLQPLESISAVRGVEKSAPPSEPVELNGRRYTKQPDGSWLREDGRKVVGRVEKQLNELAQTTPIPAAEPALVKAARERKAKPEMMTAVEINKELDRLEKQSSSINDQLIAEGRGTEKPSERRDKTDSLSLEYFKVENRLSDLRGEIRARYGPDAPSRLPRGRGFGPREMAVAEPSIVTSARERPPEPAAPALEPLSAKEPPKNAAPKPVPETKAALTEVRAELKEAYAAHRKRLNEVDEEWRQLNVNASKWLDNEAQRVFGKDRSELTRQQFQQLSADLNRKQKALFKEQGDLEKMKAESGNPLVKRVTDASLRETALLKEMESQGAAEPAAVMSARERKTKRMKEKASGIEYRRSGADPIELIDNITIRGWELYSEKIKPTFDEWAVKVKREFGTASDPHLRTVWKQLSGETEPTPPRPTAPKDAAMAVDREALGLPELERLPTVSAEEVLSKAKAANAADPRAPNILIEQALKGGKNFTNVETMQVNLRAQEIKNRHEALMKEIYESKDDAAIANKAVEAEALLSEFGRLSEGMDTAGAEWGRAGHARQRAISEDYSLVAMAARMKAAKRGELTEKERSTIDSLHQQLTAAEARAEAAEAKAAQNRAAQQIEKVRRQRTRAESKEALDREAVVIKSNIAAELARIRSQSTQASGLAGIDPEGRLTKELIRYVHNRAKANVGLKAEALIDEAHTLISDLGVSRRQVAEALVGYGDTPKQRSAAAKRVAEVNSEINRLLQTEDVAAGRRSPRQEGPKKGEARSSGVPLEGPKRSDVRKVPQQGPRRSEAQQSGIPRQGPKLSDVRQLPAEGPRKSEAARSGQPLQGPKITDAPPVGPRLSDIRKVPEQGPQMVEHGPPKEIFSRNQTRLKQLEKEKADLERRMAEGDFVPPQREPPRYTKETLAAQKEVDTIKERYNRMRYKATRGRGGMITDELAKAANVGKTIKSIGDISAVFRQGGFYALTHPIEGGVKPTHAMLRSFTELGWKNVEAVIKNDPHYEILKKAGTEFTGVEKDNPNLSRREEGYLGQEYLQYVPVAKQVANFSERTFVSFLDAQRLYMGRQMIEGLTKPQQRDPAELKAISRLLNIGTGRGPLGKRGNSIAPALNIAMFSPRLLASRVQLLNNMINPVTIARMPPGARARMIKDNVKFLAGTFAVMQLAQAAGATVSLDPDDSEFLKIRFGNIVYDQLTGLQQPLRFIINMARAASPVDSAALQAGPEMFTGQDMAEQTKRFARSKLNPGLSPAVDFVAGEDFMGRKFDAKRTAREFVTPLPASDVIEAMQQEGLIGAVKASPSLVGIGVSSYPPAPEKPTTHAEKLARKFIRDSISKDDVRTEEKIETDKEKAELRARSRMGEDVTAEMDALRLNEKERKVIEDAKGLTRIQQDFKQLSVKKKGGQEVPEAVAVYRVMTRSEKEQVRDILEDKINRMDEGDEKDELIKRLALTPRTAPRAPKAPVARRPRPARQPRVQYQLQ